MPVRAPITIAGAQTQPRMDGQTGDNSTLGRYDIEVGRDLPDATTRASAADVAMSLDGATLADLPSAMSEDAAGTAVGGDADSLSAQAPAQQVLQIGGANEAGVGFIPLADGPRPLLPGWQGAQHVWLSVRLPAAKVPAGGGLVAMAISLRRPADVSPLLPGPTKLKVSLTPIGGQPGWLGYEGIPVVVACPCYAAAEPLVVTVTVTLPTGQWSAAPKLSVSWAGACPTPPAATCVD